MFEVGSHTFSEQDARRTLRHAGYFCDLMADGRDGSLLAPVRSAITIALDGVEPDSAPLERIGPALQRVWPALLGASDLLRAAGQLPPTARGRVVQVATSSGGVPKHPAAFLDVDHAGAHGDRQRARQHHGSPFQALCIWSEEVIESFRAAGHPVYPGAAGENVTVSGLDWTTVRPGVRLRLGGVLGEVSSYSIPCAKNAAWFLDRDFQVMHHDRGPVSRLYLTVLDPGRIEPGDEVVLEP